MYISRQIKRGANFSQHERDVLIDCVQRYKNIIQDRRTDSRTVYRKQKVWEKVIVLFNSQPGVTKRTVKQLQSAWKNMKRMTKVFKESEAVEAEIDKRYEDKRRENARVLSLIETSHIEKTGVENESVMEEDEFQDLDEDIEIKMERCDDDDDDYEISNSQKMNGDVLIDTQQEINSAIKHEGFSNSVQSSIPDSKQNTNLNKAPPSNQGSSRLLAPKPHPTYQIIFKPNPSDKSSMQQLPQLAEKITSSNQILPSDTQGVISKKILISRLTPPVNNKTVSAVNKQKSVKAVKNPAVSSVNNNQPSQANNQEFSIINNNLSLMNGLQPAINNQPIPVINQISPGTNQVLLVSNPEFTSNNQGNCNSKTFGKTESFTAGLSTEPQDQTNPSAKNPKHSMPDNTSYHEHLERMKNIRLERILMRKEHREKMAMYRAQREFYEEKKRKLNS